MYHRHTTGQRITIAAIGTGVAILLMALGVVSYWRGTVHTPTEKKSSFHPFTGPANTLSLLTYLAGFDGERTFLVLFLNNTELRPAGGFMGTYALVQIQNGKVTNIKVEGTEFLDYRSPVRQETYPPPQPLIDYLKIKQWQFRDSNWSPDFAESSKWGIWLYRLEGGEAADHIDGVIAITTNVLEELVTLTGPLTVDGVTLKPGSAVADLEYEVEYGFNERGLAVAARKDIMHDFTEVLLKKLLAVAPLRWHDMLNLGQRLASEKHIIMFSTNTKIQDILRARGWSGEVPSFSESDGFMVVDANLGALKTDHAIVRGYDYKVTPTADGELLGTLRVHYAHQGVFDWRTSRYRSYTRVYLPDDAVVQSVHGFLDPENAQKEVAPDHGVRPGMHVLGGYIRLAPGESHDLVISYLLPRRIMRDVRQGSYRLIVPKQIGLVDPALTLDLDFGKKIEGTGQDRYSEKRSLREDATVQLNFE